MARFDFCPSDYSPTYDVELTSDGQFVKLHGVYDVPRGYPDSKRVDGLSGMTLEKYEQYIRGRAWDDVQRINAWREGRKN